jgi:NTE family protein
MAAGPSIRIATAIGLTLCLPIVGAAQPVGVEVRPRIGLALGGGSARGLAHVDVLEWLEEHRIPVDVIAGTSIGGLAGGGYATGRSAADVRALIETIDWDEMFRGEVAYPSKAFRRKEDRREFPVGLEFGVRDGLRLAPGLDPGHEIGLFVSRLALPYAAPLHCDDLPIPFRAVATDLEAAVPLALDRGSRAGALRATMAIPGIFEPIVLDDRFLADGGLLNNVPADVARAMGADIVIAVDVGEPLGRREALTSLVAVANQAIVVMMAPRTLAVLDQYADHVIAPAVEHVRSDAWRDFEEIRQEGYDGAAAAGGALRELSLSPGAWARHLDARHRRQVNTSVDHVAFVRVEGVDAAAANDFEAYLFGTDADVPLSWAALEERLTTVAGGWRYGSLGYDLVEFEGQAGAAVVVREKPHGPPFLNVALAFENEALALRLATHFTAYDVWVRDAEARVDVELGTDVGVKAEYLVPLARSPWFIAPSVALRRATRSFGGGQDPPASYRIRRARVGLDLGLTLGTRSELRVGYSAGSLDGKGRRVTTSPLPRLQGGEHGARWAR